MTGQKAKTMAAVVLAAAAVACGGAKRGDTMVPGSSASARIGTGGGTLQTESGVTVIVPANALSTEREVRVVESEHRQGEARHISVEPADLTLSVPMRVRVKAEDGNARDERLVEIEHAGELEIEHAIENEHEDEVEHAREVEIGHGAELEQREARTCNPACDASSECDDGTCKPHGGNR
jgi:hypothetical protein